MIKLLLDKQIFASSDARFCCGARSNGRYTQNFVHKMRNFSLNMVCVYEAYGGGLKEPQGGTSPYMKKISVSKIDL